MGTPIGDTACVGLSARDTLTLPHSISRPARPAPTRGRALPDRERAPLTAVVCRGPGGVAGRVTACNAVDTLG